LDDAVQVFIAHHKCGADKRAEWSAPMTKGKLAAKLGISEKTLDSLADQYHLKKLSRQRWQIDVTRVDAESRNHFRPTR
jgi:hypothetical protein